MNSQFYAVFNSYCPNSAVTNRTLSYLDAWETMKKETIVVFMLPDRKFSEITKKYNYIKVLYMWDKFPIRNYICHNILLFWYVSSFIKLLNPGDKVYCMGQIYLLSQVIHKKEVDVYHERTECPEIVKLGNWPYSLKLEDYLSCCRQLKGLFVISQNLKNYFVSKGVDASRVHIVNMTVDPNRFDGIMKKEGNYYIAYCGNASNNKDGVDQLIKAFSLISPKYPDVFLYIIGQAPDKNQQNNNVQLVERLGVSDKVVFTGVVASNEMPQILTDATILTLDRPDNIQAKYGFPTKLGEYLLTGNPVVVTAVGDIPLFLEEGVSGMISEPENPEAFASKIEWLLEHPIEAAKIGQRGKEVALANFNNRTEAKKIIDVMFCK